MRCWPRSVAGGVYAELGFRDTAGLVSSMLRINRTEARHRVTAAEDLGPRRGLTGELLPPVFPRLAAAQAVGTVSPEHAKIIRATVHNLPPETRAVHGVSVEATLTAQAGEFAPVELARLADVVIAALDPDGRLTDDGQHDRHRSGSLVRNRDGSGELRGHLTPECLALWQALLTPLAKARPADEVLGPDPRNPGERIHDALQEAARRLLAAGDLPALAGLPSTLVISMTLDQLESRAGAATTMHGGTLSIATALKLASQGKMLPVVLNNAGGVLAFGRERRLASPGQRLALTARDKGCTLPGCHRSAAQSEIHHLTDWASGGHTDLDNLAIACGYHNNEAPKQGWHATMINGVPHWIPPACRDPQQKPLRNTLHDPVPVKPPDDD
jgi:hypothetical protein